MLRQHLRQALDDARPALSQAGVSHLAVFGSQARGQTHAASDLDILVDVSEGTKFSLIDLVGIEQLLTTATGVKVNALMRRSLDRRFAARIDADVIEIF